jgi:signal transduction histidine kinase
MFGKPAPMISSAPSTRVLPTSWQSGESRTLLLVVGTSAWVGLWNAIQNGGSIAQNILGANATAFCIWGIVTGVRLLLRGRLPALLLVIAIPTGVVLGSRIIALSGASDYIMELFRHPTGMGRTILSNLWIGVTITAFWLHFSYSRGVREELERERRRAAEALQAETVARLALLQAQIEPHFLFNTLANIHSLIKEDPDTASLILEELNSYLRTSLRRTRAEISTVGEELELIEALLAIAAARLRTRLEYAIHATAEVRTIPLPPLLLQPLVENAIRHGIEPAVEGGMIQVDVHRLEGALELTVKDTGVGLNPEAPPGVGLANVRSRLATLYEGQGRLEFYTNTPRGVIAKLIVPVRAS